MASEGCFHLAFEHDTPDPNSLCSTSVLPTRSRPPPAESIVRLRRIMREDTCCACAVANLVTTNSNHSRAVYPNVACEIVPSGTNQLWIPFERLHYFRDAHAGLNLNVEKANAFGSGFEVAKMRLRPRQSERACVRWRKMRKRRN